MQKASIGIIYSPCKTKVLLVKRQDIPVWVLPGGGIDEGESPEAAAVREVKEETGLEVKVIRHAAHYTPVNIITKETHLFECEKVGGELSSSKETSGIGFFPLNKLPKATFILHKEWLEAVSNSPDRKILDTLHSVTWWRTAKYFLSHPLWSIIYLYRRFLSKT